MVEWQCGDVELSCLDFAGQETYYTTHQLFLCSSAVYILVWHPRLHVDQQTQFWLKSIESRAEGVPVLVVASHHDGRHKVGSLFEEALRSRYPCLHLQFANVSSISGHGIVELRKLIADAALSLPHTRKVSLQPVSVNSTETVGRGTSNSNSNTKPLIIQSVLFCRFGCVACLAELDRRDQPTESGALSISRSRFVQSCTLSDGV
jgi:hypothetical protein